MAPSIYQIKAEIARAKNPGLLMDIIPLYFSFPIVIFTFACDRAVYSKHFAIPRTPICHRD